MLVLGSVIALVIAIAVVAVSQLHLPSTSTVGLPPMRATEQRIPDTSYRIPAGAVFVSLHGADSNPGTVGAPLKTLDAALSAVPPGGTVVFRAGVYRDAATKRIAHPVTLQPYPHEAVWFDGMDKTTGWLPDQGAWSLSWTTPHFCDGHYYDVGFRQQTASGPCTYPDQYGDRSNPMAADPQMVYVDGKYVPEVSTASEAVGRRFFYDTEDRKIVLGMDPSGHTVEVTARATALFVEGGPGSVTIRGLGFAHYASDNFAGAAGHGAVTINAPRTTLHNNVFSHNAGAGLHLANPKDAVVRANVFYANGANGLDADGHQQVAGMTDDLLLEDNIFDGNNTERFGAGCSFACQAAGSKLTHMVNFTARGNVFRNQVAGAHGLWCDLACSGGVIVSNSFVDNGGHGIYYEVSNTGIIASNLIVGNGEYGLKVSAAHTKIYNNTVVGNAGGALIYDDNRSFGVAGWDDVGPDTADVQVQNNIFSANGTVAIRSWRTGGRPNPGPDTFYASYDFNSYGRSTWLGTAPAEWRDRTRRRFRSVHALHAHTGNEGHGQDITSATDPFFVDLANGDYRIRRDSVAYRSGQSLPGDVAAALGVARGPVSRGALL